MAMSIFSDYLIISAMTQIIVGFILMMIVDDISKNKYLILALNIIAFFLGFGLFVGPIIGLIGIFIEIKS